MLTGPGTSASARPSTAEPPSTAATRDSWAGDGAVTPATLQLPRAREYVRVHPRAQDRRLEALMACFLAPPGAVPAPRTLLVAAHPDDETIGAGAMLPRLADGLTLLHVTDGAPRHRRQWGRQEYRTWEEYASQRRRELEAALRVAGIDPAVASRLGVMDNEATLNLVALTHQLMEVIDRARPQVLLTHPYEGGHTDHDATAFAARAACRLLARDGETPPALAEFTSYHNLGGERVLNRFLPFEGVPVTDVPLSAEEKDVKRRMCDCYITQIAAIRDVPIRYERFRAAPRYDFTQAPHPGRLRCERYPFGMNGAEWRAHAAAALRELGLDREK